MAFTFTAFNLSIFTSGLAVISIGFYLGSLFTIEWMWRFILDFQSEDFGLFKFCLNGKLHDIEDSVVWKDHSDAIKATQAFVILGAVFVFLGLVTTVVTFPRLRKRPGTRSRTILHVLLIVGVVSYLLAFVFSMVAIGVYQNAVYGQVEVGTLTKSLGYSFYLCAAGGAFSELALDLWIYTAAKSFDL